MKTHDLFGFVGRLAAFDMWPHGVHRGAVKGSCVGAIAFPDDRLEIGRPRAHAEHGRHACIQIQGAIGEGDPDVNVHVCEPRDEVPTRPVDHRRSGWNRERIDGTDR